MIIDIDDSSFEQEVLKEKLPVIVDFWAPWCGPCKMLNPILQEAAQKFAGKIRIVKMNIEESPNVPSEHGVRSIPTMIMFAGGKSASTKIGLLSKEKLENWINESLLEIS